MPPPVRATNLVAGGGTPGGSSGQVQYNNAGAFGGLTGITTSGGNATALDFGGTTDATLTRSAAGTMAVEGVDLLTTSSTNTNVTGKTFRGPSGSCVSPTYSFSSDNTRGMLMHGSVGNAIQFCVGGGTMLTMANSGMYSYGRDRIAVTSTATTSNDTSEEMYTNAGDTDGATVTLVNNPATTYSPWHFAVVVAQTFTIQPSSGETLYLGSSTCSSISSATIGDTMTVQVVTLGSGGAFMAFGATAGWACNP